MSNQIIEFFLKKCKNTLKSSDNNYSKYDCYLNSFEKAQKLLKASIKNVPKEYNLIVALYELNMILYSIHATYPDYFFKNFNQTSEIENFYPFIVDQVSSWVEKEFDQSMPSNFGLEDQVSSKKFMIAKSKSKSISSSSRPSGILSGIWNIFGTSTETANNLETVEIDFNEPLLYSMLLKINPPLLMQAKNASKYTNKVEESILEVLKKRIRQSNNLQLIMKTRIEFNFKELDYGLLIKNLFDTVVMEDYLEKKKSNLVNLCKALSNHNKELQSYISKYLEKKTANLNIAESGLRYVLENTDFVVLIKNHFADRNSSPISDEWYEKLFLKLIAQLVNAVNEIMSGTEKVSTIILFKANLENALELLKVLTQYKAQFNLKCKFGDYSCFRQMVNTRMTEIDMFKKCRDNIVAFIQICSKLRGSLLFSYFILNLKINKKEVYLYSYFIDVDFSLHERKIIAITKNAFESYNLNSLCSPISLEELKSKLQKQVVVACTFNVIYFDHINKDNYQKLYETVQLDRVRCVIFDFYLEQTFNEWRATVREKSTLVDILSNVIEITFTK